jgi:hypothetical protein
MPLRRRASAALRDAGARLADLGRGDAPQLAARLTLLTLLLSPIGALDLRAWVLALAAAGLLAPRLASSPALWLALAALAALRVVGDWPMSDNHAWLLAIWCLALALAFRDADPGERLARDARVLVGAVFALATLQKALISPDYLDGTFFRWLLATDARFESLGELLGRDAADLARTRAFLDGPLGEARVPDAAFVETPALRIAAQVLTWATLAIEAGVALAFLAPARRVPAALRDGALLAFCAGTYAIAPVAGFGWLLLSMGVAQSGGPRSRWLHLAAFALLVFHREVPWFELLARLAA